MSNVINFNARDFSGSIKRLIISGIDGKNVELCEIGKYKMTTTEIYCKKQLEPNTDYVFRFSITGGYNNNKEAISELNISLDEKWSERYSYDLLLSRLKPIFTTYNAEKELLRVYEIPFTTGETGTVRFEFVAQAVTARIMPALENEAYESYITPNSKSSQISKIEVSKVAEITLNEKLANSDADIQVTVVDKEEADTLKNAIENVLAK